MPTSHVTLPTSPLTVRLGADIEAAMARLEERDGISRSEMTRRALVAFLVKKGVMAKPKKGAK